MKAVMAVGVSVAANATNKNVFSGETYERVPFDSLLDLYVAGSAAGLLQTLIVGGNLIVSEQPVNANNRVPIVPDDIVLASVPVRQGQLVQLRAANSTGGALTINARVEFTQAVFG